ncbi:hypothetical protein NLY43_01865 [Mesorhizobium sp. C416B]|nr:MULTISPECIES: hypothetical protein [unclassified Mesorhizobium]ESX75307.1 hypothetical protein X758_06800 [Mesorhizobium sp. LSHC416B00]ESX11224.1 hypothetical protein X768_11820 [Mesorhizobium sp. LSJC265A00]ESX57123.1 hypothetical protein X761_05155 [Mesorhizobium sp. LSHC424B00]WJI63556.1 hypothetical protein NLY43_01865 [Mesorhizobium sp. C416B]WJI69180.1 hypothetical protein NLY36_31180 [Mesorhizobium sp. C399B]
MVAAAGASQQGPASKHMAGRAEGVSQNLTGVWSGRYFYPRELPPVSFVATLIETATGLTGMTHEPAATSTARYASLQGQREGNAVSFTKTYDKAQLKAHPIHYSGIINGDATEIKGTWRIPGYWSGNFLMIRSPGKVAAVTRKVAERV